MNYFCVKTRLKLLLLLCFLSTHLIGYAQNDVNITIVNGNITIKESLREVEKQTGKSVAYNESKLDVDKHIRLDITNKPLEEALNTILSGTGFTYQLKNEYIIIVPRKKDKTPKQIKGNVLDEYGDPLIGANVSVKGTGSGTITDLDGNFSVSATKGTVLAISYLGYTTQNITVSDNDSYTVKMVARANELDAVVVTALGIKRSQKAMSYNVQEVISDDITKVKDANFVNSLSGKVAGATINASSSGVGGASKVVMRGAKSIEQSNNALYVIDGIPMFNLGREGGTEFDSSGTTEAIADINPEDIESLSVLTGSAAAALYGNEGARGVIIITTKKGKIGKTSVTVSQNTEFLEPFFLPKFQNRYGTGSLLNPKIAVVDKSWGNKLNSANRMGYSPKDDYFKTGVVTTETVSFSTGTEKNQTYASISVIDSRGIVPNNNYDRYNFTFRNTSSFLNDKMTLDLGANYIKQSDLNMSNQGTYQNPLVGAYLFPRGDDWNDIKMYERYNTQRKISTQYWPQGISEYTGQNPYWINYRNLRENKKDRYMFNTNLSYEIFDWFNVSGRVKIDNSDTEYTEKLYATSNTTLTEGSNNGFFGVRRSKDKQIYADLIANINKPISENLTSHTNIGVSLSDVQQSLIQMRGPLVDKESSSAIPNKFALGQLDQNKLKYLNDGFHDQTQSLFASTELGFKNAYYLTLTGRFDWPSQLAGNFSDTKYFFYPSVGVSFILSEIIPMPEQIKYMKIRASFAEVGNPFSRGLANLNYAWDNNQQSYIPESHYPISSLKPEKTNSWEIGLTTRFLNNFNLDISVYDSKTFNQTFNPRLSVSSGFNKLFVQTGSVRNRGLELSLGYSNTWNQFKWSSYYTLSLNRNEIQELVRDWRNPLTGELVNKDRLDVGGLSDAHFILTEGGTLGDLYSIYDLQRDSDGSIYVGADGNVISVRAKEPIKLGSVFPKANMGWRNDFTWKNLSFGCLISARLGGIVYSATQAVMDRYGVSEASAAARDKGGVMINGGDMIDAERWFTVLGRSSGIPQYYTYSATNVRLQEASIGYTFTKSQLWNIADVTVSLVGRNLLMIYNKAPFDPEAVATTGNYYQGIDYFMMPNTRSLGFNVRMKF